LTTPTVQENEMTEQQFTTESDPADFTVDQVNAYLATADEAEQKRVLDAEASGKNRSTIKAPDGDQADQGDGTTPGLDTGSADTLKQAAAKATEPEGEHYQKGYLGYAPSRDGDNPVDLTLAAVTGQKDA
jgi:hypothetical protein